MHDFVKNALSSAIKSFTSLALCDGKAHANYILFELTYELWSLKTACLTMHSTWLKNITYIEDLSAFHMGLLEVRDTARTDLSGGCCLHTVRCTHRNVC